MLLELVHVRKSYGAVRAVDDVSLRLEGGLIHAVVGENGAGKSSLLKIAAGLVKPDAGEVRIDGGRLSPHTARRAIACGVGIVQQHFALVGALSAIENVMLGVEPTRSFGRLDVEQALRQARAVADEMGIEVPWNAPSDTLGVGDRQRLEIVRTLARNAQILILDEPTAVLTPGEATQLYVTLRRLADAGRAVAVVTHRLDEVSAHADVASVMRHGKLISSTRVMRSSADGSRQLARDIMGEDPPAELARRQTKLGPVKLEMKDVSLGRHLQGVTLSVHAGEIVGVAGVEGNGQRELVRVLAGLDAPDGGSLQSGPSAVVHEDRHAEGLVLSASVRDNLVLGELSKFSRFGIVSQSSLDESARARLDRAHIVPADLNIAAAALSGGNQQKIVVARAIARATEGRASVLVFAQPTRGVDLGAARAIHSEILAAANAGNAVLVISADLGELRILSDRILVMARGRIVSELPANAPDAQIGEAMLGGSLEQAP